MTEPSAIWPGGYCINCGEPLEDGNEWECDECEAIAAGLLDECDTCGTAIAKGERYCLIHAPEPKP